VKAERHSKIDKNQMPYAAACQTLKYRITAVTHFLPLFASQFLAAGLWNFVDLVALCEDYDSGGRKERRK
jgi:hypothetical protein